MNIIEFYDRNSKRTRVTMRFQDVRIKNSKDGKKIRIAFSGKADDLIKASGGIRIGYVEGGYIICFVPDEKLGVKAHPSHRSKNGTVYLEIGGADDVKRLQKYIGDYNLEKDEASGFFFIDRRHGF